MTALDKTHSRRLIVEGKNDGYALRALLSRRGANWELPDQRLPFVEVSGSIEKVLDAAALSAAIKVPLQRLGIIIDADDDVQARWTQAHTALTNAGVRGIAAGPAPGGVIVDGPFQGQKIGVWLMPNNEACGKLETFLQGLVPPADPVWPIAERATDEAMLAGAPLRAVDRQKGVVHAWLAWQEQPGLPFGTAITASVFRAEGPNAESFVNWFHGLFDA